MASANGLIDFYDNSVTLVDDPSDTSYINYPFVSRLLGATLAKITGLPTITAAFFFTTLSLLILVGAFYYYSGTCLTPETTDICRFIPALDAAVFAHSHELFAQYLYSAISVPPARLHFQRSSKLEIIPPCPVLNFHHHHQPYRNIRIPSRVYPGVFSFILPVLGAVLQGVSGNHRDLIHIRYCSFMVP